MDNNLPEVTNHGGVNFKDQLAAFKKAGLKIHASIWSTLYLYLADYLSVINITCDYYLNENAEMSIEDGRKIQTYNRKASLVVEKILYPAKIQDDEGLWLKIKDEALRLDPSLKNFLSHFVGNRLHAMGFVIDSHISDEDASPISIEHVKMIYQASSQIISVFEAVRKELQGKDMGF